MPNQSYYGDPYNQGFNYTTKFGKKPKTEGDKLREEGAGEDGGFIDSGELAPDGTVQESSIEDIQSDIVKQKQLRDAQENQEFDKTIAGGTLEDLRKGVDIKKKTTNYITPEQLNDAPMKTTDLFGDVLMLAATYAAVKNPINTVSTGLDVLFPDENIKFEQWTRLNPKLHIASKGTQIAAIKSNQYLQKLANSVVDYSRNVKEYISHQRGGLKVASVEGVEVDNLYSTFLESRKIDNSPGGGGINPIRQPEVPQLARMYFARSGLRDGVFDLDTWRKAGSDRNVMELFQTRWDQVAYRQTPGKQFTSTRKRLIKPFLEEYGDYLKRFDIDPSTVELHHIFGVNLSAPLYDGLQYGSKEWTDMTDLLNKMDVFPGAPTPKGGTFEAAKKSNLMLALEEPHDLLHQQFFKDRIGVKGEKFFNQERVDLIRSGLAGRNQVAKEYAKIIKQGETLIQRGMDQIQNVFGKTDVSPEKLADAFSQSLADGTTNIFKEGYKIESVNEVIKELVFDIQIDEMITPLKQKAFGTIDELKQEILLDKAAGLSQKQLKKKYGKKFDIRQFDLFE